MISVRIIADAVRDDGKTCAEKGQVGLVDSKEWDGQGGTVRVLLEGKKNRATVPREACRAIRFGLWDVHDREFIAEGSSALSFDNPKEALDALGDTATGGLVVAEVIEGPWDSPRAFDSDTIPAELAALLNLSMA